MPFIHRFHLAIAAFEYWNALEHFHALNVAALFSHDNKLFFFSRLTFLIRFRFLFFFLFFYFFLSLSTLFDKWFFLYYFLRTSNMLRRMEYKSVEHAHTTNKKKNNHVVRMTVVVVVVVAVEEQKQSNDDPLSCWKRDTQFLLNTYAQTQLDYEYSGARTLPTPTKSERTRIMLNNFFFLLLMDGGSRCVTVWRQTITLIKKIL